MKPLSEEQRDEILVHFAELVEDDFIEWLYENTRSYEPPNVIYKGSGWTGAQKKERDDG